MVMVIEASFADGRGVANALHMTADKWLALQAGYQVGELLMPCRRRQERDRSEGIRALWLMRSDRYLTLVKSIGKARLRTEFGGQQVYSSSSITDTE